MPSSGRPAVPRWLAVATAYSWRLLIVGAAVVAVAVVVARLYLVFLPLFAALLLATILAPAVDALARRGLHRGVAAAAAIALSLALLAGLFALIGPPFVAEIDDLGDEVNDGIDAAERWLVGGPLDLSEQQLRNAVDSVAEQLRGNVGALTAGALAGAIVVLEIATGAVLAIVLLFFLLKDGSRIWSWLLDLFGERRRDADAVGRRAWQALGGYVRGATVVAAFDAVFIGLALLAIGVPLVLPLAVITFFAAYVPIVGATVSGLLAVVVALVTLGFVDALLVLAAIIVVQQVESNVLQPIVMGRAVRLHPIATLLGVTAGALLYGVVGAFVAVPLMAVAGSTLAYARERHGGASGG